MLDTETVSLAPQGQGRVAFRLLERRLTFVANNTRQFLRVSHGSGKARRLPGDRNVQEEDDVRRIRLGDDRGLDSVSVAPLA